MQDKAHPLDTTKAWGTSKGGLKRMLEKKRMMKVLSLPPCLMGPFTQGIWKSHCSLKNLHWKTRAELGNEGSKSGSYSLGREKYITTFLSSFWKASFGEFSLVSAISEQHPCNRPASNVVCDPLVEN